MNDAIGHRRTEVYKMYDKNCCIFFKKSFPLILNSRFKIFEKIKNRYYFYKSLYMI